VTGVGAVLVGGARIPGQINQSTLEDGTGSSGAAGAQIRFVNDGTYEYGDTGVGGMIGGSPWCVPSTTAVAALYQLQVNVLAGAVASGTFDTWIDLSSTRTYWTLDTPGTNTVRVRIREKGTGLVRCDQNVSMNVA
jgi:hypothetical protein